MSHDPIDLRAHPHGIYGLDSGYVRPRLDAIHFIVEKGRVAFIDTGTHDSVPRMLEALSRLGLGAEAIDYVIPTHVHLDHAGGAGLLMQRAPNATLVIHPRGAGHMIDPSKLWAGTVAVYGEERARRDYGELVPVPRERVIEAPDGASVSLAGRELVFLDTPGHAKHHFCVWDQAARALFTGDTFGCSYRELDDAQGRAFMFASTTPTQFDPPALRASIDRLLALKPEAIYVTHYSRLTDVERLGVDLRRVVDGHEAVGLRWADCADPVQRERGLRRDVEELARAEARRAGGDEDLWVKVLENDILLNAQGLASWLDFRNRKAA
jgi:glyoxylase-like metal-dependent hydrolase (beta-lactamase superfamily II)